MLGLTRRSWDSSRSAAVNSHTLLLEGWYHGNMDLLYEVAESYDVLEDLPWPLVYKQMAEHYPDAKFVLTRRKSTRRWYRSAVRHTRRVPIYWMHETIFGAELAENDPEGYKSTYRNHLRDARQFFAGSDRFLEICWECGDGWSELCGFLNVPVPDVPFPWSNASPKPPLKAALSRPVRTLLRS